LAIYHIIKSQEQPSKNMNMEIRNTKQYRNANFQNSKQKPHDTTISCFGHAQRRRLRRVLIFLSFVFFSSFEFQISYFPVPHRWVKCMSLNEYFMLPF